MLLFETIYKVWSLLNFESSLLSDPTNCRHNTGSVVRESWKSSYESPGMKLVWAVLLWGLPWGRAWVGTGEGGAQTPISAALLLFFQLNCLGLWISALVPDESMGWTSWLRYLFISQWVTAHCKTLMLIMTLSHDFHFKPQKNSRHKKSCVSLWKETTMEDVYKWFSCMWGFPKVQNRQEDLRTFLSKGNWI